MLDFLKFYHIYSYLINQLFPFPPAQNNSIADEAKEQVQIGRLGTTHAMCQQFDREREARKALQKDQTPKPVKKKTKSIQGLASRSKRRKVMVSPYMIWLSIHDLNKFHIYNIKNTCTFQIYSE